MIGLTLFYMTMSAAALGCAALSHERDRRHALQIAAVLALGCACANSTWLSRNWWMWPPMDAVTAWFVAVRCRIVFRPWKLMVILASAAQIFAHVNWQVGDKFGGSPYAYHLTLNVLFLVQLAAVANSGRNRVCRAVRVFVAGRVGCRRPRGVDLLHRAGVVRPRKG